MLTETVSIPHVSRVTAPPPDRLEQARELIRAGGTLPGHAPLFYAEEEALVEALKGEERFDYARKLLELWRDPDALARHQDHSPERLAWLTQQHALCTYKDPDLPADGRLRQAWKILSGICPPQCTDAETLGLAGAIQKRWWEHNARREHLELSLAYNRRGFAAPNGIGSGYTAINAAFVLDLLAGQQGDGAADGAASSLRAQANEIREQIVTALTAPDEPGQPARTRDWWHYATLVEAYFGLGRYGLAKEMLVKGIALDPSAWKRDSTARQLARIYVLATGQTAEEARAAGGAWEVLSALYDGDQRAVRTAFMGKVGLALSGGGFRASLFHLGVLARLAEADVLRHVEVISCVSGGSIVGAHYYLALQELLQSRPDDKLGPRDYVDLVRRVASTFLHGVQRNLRMRVLANPAANLAMAWSDRDSRSRRLAVLYERELFDRLRPDGGHPAERTAMPDLLIQPAGEAAGFKPRKRNWARVHKVPTLVLNATTLNTGHNWQFTAAWMGEPPGPIDSDVDGNDWLRRMPYGTAPSLHRRVPLGDAVAASAGVPGLFEPLDLPWLYPGRTVRLVDGGVHDNQGIASLLEQECAVMIVSDASGQMASERDPQAHGALPLGRSNSILQARVRQAQHAELAARRSSSLLRGLAFLHLQRGLYPPAVDWLGCTEPEAQFGDRSREEPAVTEYGVPSEIQRCLAAVRTDLDAFHLAEAYALMSSGYRMAAHYLRDAIPDAPPPGVDAQSWFFQQVDTIFAEQDAAAAQKRTAPRYARLRELLKASSAVGGKAWKVSWTGAQLTAATVLVLVALGVAGWMWGPEWLRTALGWTGWIVGVSAALAGLGYVLEHVRPVRGVVHYASLVGGTVMGVVGWMVAGVYLLTLNRAYLQAGRLDMRAPWEPFAPPPE
jgi:predicted acylesterase/phospholipase RssA